MRPSWFSGDAILRLKMDRVDDVLTIRSENLDGATILAE